MAQALLSLGLFVFELPSLVHQAMDTTTQARFAEGERFGQMGSLQYCGPGGQDITLSGVTAYGLMDDAAAFEQLKEMQATGQAWPLIDSAGDVLGQFVITSISQRGGMIGAAGQPRRTDWTLELRRAPEGTGTAEAARGPTAAGAA